MTLKTSQLAGNIVEICYAKERGHLIVADGSGNVWDAEVGVGKIVRWGTSILSKWWNLEEGLLKDGCRKTHEAFSNALSKIEYEVHVYDRLVLTSYYQNLTETQYALQRGVLSRLSFWEKKVFSLFRYPTAFQELRLIYETFQGEGDVELNVEECIKHAVIVLKHSQEVIELCSLANQLNYDGDSFKHFPYKTLDLCSLSTPLSETMKNEVKDFIHRLEIFVEEVSYQELWVCFNQLIKLANKHSPQKGKRSILELANLLSSEGLDIFTRRDPLCHKWVQELMRGGDREVTVGDNIYTISGLLQVPTYEGDGHVVFSIKDHREWIYIASGVNPFVLAQEVCQMQKEEVGIPLQKIECLDDEGLGAIQERLGDCVESHYWNDDPTMFIQMDHIRLQNIISWISLLVKDEFLPTPLNSQHIMFTLNHELRLLKPVEKGEFNCTELEEFIWKCSQYNEYVYERICKETLFSKHPWMDYVFMCVQKRLVNEPIDLAREAMYRGIEDSNFIKKIQILQSEILEIKEGVLMLCQHQGIIFPDLESFVNEEITKQFLSKNLTLRLPPSFKRSIFNCILSRTRLP